MATYKQIKQLQDLIDQVTGTPVDELVVNVAEWGRINFEDCRENLTTVFTMLTTLKSLPINWIPDTVMKKFIAHTTNFVTQVQEIKNFKIAEQPEQQREALANNVLERSSNVISSIAPWIGTLAYLGGDAEESIRKISSRLLEVDKYFDSTKEEMERKTKEMAQIVAGARDASAKVGVGLHAGDFSLAAKDFDKSAKCWLAATTFLAAFTILIAVLFATKWGLPIFDSKGIIIEEFPWPIVIQHTTTKLVVLGLLFSATVWCGTLFKSAKHQETTNLHRANALKTFQTFVNASDDEAVKDAVLLETTRSIFAITPSGYIGTLGASPEGTRLIEILKSGATKTTSGG